MSKTNIRLVAQCALVGALLFSAHCASGDQKVVWQKTGTIDRAGSVSVVVEKNVDVKMPESEWQFLESDIKSKVAAQFLSSAKNKVYVVKVSVTRYDEGNAFARFMLAGLGQMHLNAVVEVKLVKPESQVSLGEIRKNYSWGGIMGGSAEMHETITIKVGQDIADAVNGLAATPNPS